MTAFILLAAIVLVLAVLVVRDWLRSQRLNKVSKSFEEKTRRKLNSAGFIGRLLGESNTEEEVSRVKITAGDRILFQSGKNANGPLVWGTVARNPKGKRVRIQPDGSFWTVRRSVAILERINRQPYGRYGIERRSATPVAA